MGTIQVLPALSIAQNAAPVAGSIRDFVTGDGKTDDTKGVAAAFAACKNSAFTLRVDCPVFLHIGSDIARPIFIDDGTRVEFTDKGLFITDNLMIPAFVLANSDDVKLVNWRVEYRGGIPVDPVTGGYFDDGRFVPSTNRYPAAAQFNDVTLTNWLSKNRGITFDRAKGRVTSPWAGPTNTASLFFLLGSTSHLEITRMKLFVPRDTGGHQFIPMGFSMTAGFKSEQTVTKDSPLDATCCSVPSHLTFEDVDLDGYYMGWQGKVSDSQFKHIRAHRYGDLQDKDGQNVGGFGKWFAPPHLFYLNFDPKAVGLENRNIHISDVIDFGNRVGTARDVAGDKPLSGYANSLKIGAIDSSVDRYTSNRPDGLMDILNCDHLTLTKIDGTYDSSFLNDLYPGIRFPSTRYQHLTLEDVTLTDTAEHPKARPVGDCRDPSNVSIHIKNMHVILKEWPKGQPPKPVIAGDGNEVDVRVCVAKAQK